MPSSILSDGFFASLSSSMVNLDRAETLLDPPARMAQLAAAERLLLDDDAILPYGFGSDRTLGRTLTERREAIFAVGGGSALAVIFLFVFPRSRRRTWTVMLGLMLLLTVVGAPLGCGGGSPTTPPTTTTPGTAPGAYTITVTGASGAISETVKVSVTIN